MMGPWSCWSLELLVFGVRRTRPLLKPKTINFGVHNGLEQNDLVPELTVVEERVLLLIEFIN